MKKEEAVRKDSQLSKVIKDEDERTESPDGDTKEIAGGGGERGKPVGGNHGAGLQQGKGKSNYDRNVLVQNGT